MTPVDTDRGEKKKTGNRPTIPNGPQGLGCGKVRIDPIVPTTSFASAELESGVLVMRDRVAWPGGLCGQP